MLFFVINHICDITQNSSFNFLFKLKIPFNSITRLPSSFIVLFFSAQKERRCHRLLYSLSHVFESIHKWFTRMIIVFMCDCLPRLNKHRPNCRHVRPLLAIAEISYRSAEQLSKRFRDRILCSK